MNIKDISKNLYIIADIWPTIPDTADNVERNWIRDEHTYHDCNITLKDYGFTPITCLLTNNERASKQRDGLYYEFFPVDNPESPYLEQSSQNLMEFIQTLEPDILILHTLNHNITNQILKEKSIKKKKVLQVNTYNTEGSTFSYILENKDCVDLFFANSAGLFQTLYSDYKIPASKILIVPSAVNSKIFKPLSHIEKKWDLIWTGQLRENDDKRAELFIPLIQQADVSFLFVGRGKKKDLLEQEAKEKNLDNKICFMDWVQYTELPKFLNSAWIYVTVAAMDPSSRSLSEALSCGLPAVCFSDCLGTESQIIHNYNGFRVKDLYEMSKAINTLLRDKDLYKIMSENSICIAKDVFGKETRTKKLTDAYIKLLGK